MQDHRKNTADFPIDDFCTSLLVTGAVKGLLFDIFYVKAQSDLESWFRVHSRSWKIVPSCTAGVVCQQPSRHFVSIWQVVNDIHAHIGVKSPHLRTRLPFGAPMMGTPYFDPVHTCNPEATGFLVYNSKKQNIRRQLVLSQYKRVTNQAKPLHSARRQYVRSAAKNYV